ncbi:MAG: 1-acyl-sn-glycerol-3-phosphate acyltransferase, partial [Bacteroidia bacterium]|nr:1-acyl-sn-glycerol-3-phosphate acyltransferase [Bacteroidia bacterium]
MSELYNFDDLRPYYDHEVQEVIHRMVEDPLFMQLINYFWPHMTKEVVMEKVARVKCSIDFQVEFMDLAIKAIVNTTSKGLTSSGFENIQPNENYLFVANHRDILLDSAILQVLLFAHGHETSEITFGNNLMEKGFITDFGRINRMFTVQREGTARELYDISKKLSAYIRHTILDKKVSVWIAQRNGRTKDGNDQTQTGLLKMLNISGKKSFSENFKELKIVPLSISYEYEPCDFLKVQELYLSSLHTKYKKTEGEDLNSILTGIKQQKGRIHLAVGKPIIHELDEIDKLENENEKIKQLTALIDNQIYNNYKLWPVNYIAADIMDKSDRFVNEYSTAEKENFINYIDSQ